MEMPKSKLEVWKVFKEEASKHNLSFVASQRLKSLLYTQYVEAFCGSTIEVLLEDYMKLLVIAWLDSAHRSIDETNSMGSDGNSQSSGLDG